MSGFCHSHGKLSINTWACLKAGKVCAAHGSKVTVTSPLRSFALELWLDSIMVKRDSVEEQRCSSHRDQEAERERGRRALLSDLPSPHSPSVD